MRIIAGELRGRRIAAPAGREVRPTADRVREALFSSLGGRVMGARVLDLFAGSGALGLEALSRGAVAAVFVERARPVIEVLRRNIDALGMADRARVIPGDAAAALGALARRGETFEVVFLDPPYRGGALEDALGRLAAANVLAAGAVIIAEHPTGAEPSPAGSLRAVAVKRYGDTSLTFLEQAP